MNVIVKFDINKVLKREKQILEKNQFLLDQQVLKDSNYYVPEDEGTLQDKGIVATGGGKIIWDIEYAKKQYYEYPNKSKDKNPNARMKWFEAAKSVKKKEWLRIANVKYNK